jgi:hypothetical protein
VKVIEPCVALADTVPHCINNPFGNLEKPLVAILETPRFNIWVLILFATILAENVATFENVTALLTVVTFKTLAVNGEVTFKVFATVIAALALIPDELAIKTFAEVFALITISVSEVTSKAGPEVLPVLKVKLVEPLEVLIEVVVNDDIKL